MHAMKYSRRCLTALMAVLTAGLSLSCDTQHAHESQNLSGAEDSVTISFSWWGGDSRHTATQEAVNRFMELHPDIKVKTQFSAWEGWENVMSTSFYAGTMPDVNQINWNWISAYSSDGSRFLDLNTVSDTLDLAQYDSEVLQTCTFSDELQAVPVSLTGRIFFWNKTTFEQAGLAPPQTLAQLYDAGRFFREQLGEGYYPLVLGEYDRTILMVYYLQSVYGKEWIENGRLNYSEEEILSGFRFIQSLEEGHVIPKIETTLGDGAVSIDKNQNWINGSYAGIFEWDSAAQKYQDSLSEGNELVVGTYFADMGPYQGGFSKVSLCFAISETTPHPQACAALLQFLLNEREGAEILGIERGIPLSASALGVCKEQSLLESATAQANDRIIEWVSFTLDPAFEDSKLKGEPDGIYYDVMSGLSYGDYTPEQATDLLIRTTNEILAEN